jgi:hypothetical protein
MLSHLEHRVSTLEEAEKQIALLETDDRVRNIELYSRIKKVVL